jgi:hypothetical protein
MSKNIFLWQLITAFAISLVTTNPLIAGTETSVDIFQIKRNKNNNRVQYAVYINAKTCMPRKKKPAHVFWRDLEISPTEINPLKWYEKPAYGIESQKINGDELKLRLTPLPEKLITVKFVKADSGCEITPFVSINNRQSKLREIYVFAKEGLFWPTVKWIEIKGMNAQGEHVMEHIDK